MFIHTCKTCHHRICDKYDEKIESERSKFVFCKYHGLLSSHDCLPSTLEKNHSLERTILEKHIATLSNEIVSNKELEVGDEIHISININPVIIDKVDNDIIFEPTHVASINTTPLGNEGG